MPEYQFKNVNCNLCGTAEGRVIETDGPCQVIQCRNCTLTYVTPQPEEIGLFEHYDQDYYQPWLNQQIHTRERMWRRRLKKVEELKSKGTLLDVGAACGAFLKTAQQNSWDVCGVEVSEFGARYCREELGLNVLQGDFMSAHFADNAFDVVTLWHVLEHTHDPLANLKEAHRVLRPGGLLLVAVPNVHNYLYQWIYQILKRKQLKYFTLEDREVHLYHFSIQTLSQMIRKAGLQVIGSAVDKERVLWGERLHDQVMEIIYKITGCNWGMAIEVYGIKKD